MPEYAAIYKMSFRFLEKVTAHNQYDAEAQARAALQEDLAKLGGVQQELAALAESLGALGVPEITLDRVYEASQGELDAVPGLPIEYKPGKTAK
jgi:hypothetical protein